MAFFGPVLARLIMQSQFLRSCVTGLLFRTAFDARRYPVRLTVTVYAADRNRLGYERGHRQSSGDCFDVKGEPRGQWWGSGAAALGLAPGSEIDRDTHSLPSARGLVTPAARWRSTPGTAGISRSELSKGVG